MKREPPEHIRIPPVVRISYKIQQGEQPAEIAASVPSRPAPVQAQKGEEHEIEAILKHRKKGKGYRFLTLIKGGPTHDDESLSKKSFVDKDGTVTQLWIEF